MEAAIATAMGALLRVWYEGDPGIWSVTWGALTGLTAGGVIVSAKETPGRKRSRASLALRGLWSGCLGGLFEAALKTMAIAVWWVPRVPGPGEDSEWIELGLAFLWAGALAWGVLLGAALGILWFLLAVAGLTSPTGEGIP